MPYQGAARSISHRGLVLDSEHFDALSRAVSARRSRRAAAYLFGGLLALPALVLRDDASAKRRKRKNRKRKKPDNGGDPPACVPDCGGGARCDVSDGCGGTCACAAGSLCWVETCRACDVIHNGNDVASGQALRQKMSIPLDDDSYVYVCPGRYAGYFVHAGGNVVGAGDGADPASSTILDAAGLPVPGGNPKAVLAVASGAVSRIYHLRVTGSTQRLTHGVRVPSGTHLTMDSSTVTGNKGQGVSGLDLLGSFELVDCTISDNGSTTEELPYTYFGGGIHAASTLVSDIIGCHITGNMSGGAGGGGLYVENGPLNVFRTEISGNTARSASGKGGGIYQTGGSIVLRADTRIAGNTAGAPNGGGGIYQQGGAIEWQGPTVRQNTPNNCVNVPECSG